MKATGNTAASESPERMDGLAESDPRFGKKLIAIGWDTPNPKVLKENLESFERSGYDGVVISARHNPANRHGVQEDPRLKHALDNETFLPAELRIEDFRVAVDDLRSTPFQNLTDNFLSITHINAATDFFNTKEFDALAHNAGVAAAVARESGTKGFWFDVEDYFKIGFFCYQLTHETHKDYKPAMRTAGKTFSEYQDAAREAGRRWMEAVCNEYPDITIIMVWAHHQPAGRVRAGVHPESDLYGLLPSFVDGMIEAGEQATIVDGYEGAYGFLRRAEFLEAYHDIRHYGRGLSKVPHLYDTRLQAGFGLWLDMLKKWSTTDLESNHFSPQRLAESLRCALDVSDKYVWVWSEAPFRWGDEPHQQAYRQAVLDARRPLSWARIHLPPSQERNPDFRSALDSIGFFETHALLMTLPRQWQFRLDPDDVGLKREWYLENPDSREWQSIEIGKHWEDQGHDYDGYAWYRLCLDVPPEATNGKILLAVGAVDESAWIYLNGQEICVHDLGIEGWNLAFTADVSGRLDPGKNDLVIRVLDRIAAGGIWKDILLVREA